MSRIVTFNVNGFRSIVTKAKDGTKLGKTPCTDNVLTRLLDEINPDVLCLQEIRCDSSQDLSCLNLKERGYEYSILHSATKKGYSGTAIFSKYIPLSVMYGFNNYDDDEGRAITVEYDHYQLINVYVPNSKSDLSRLGFRVNTWDASLMKHIGYLQEVNPTKPVILCGDMNAALENIDVHNPSSAKGCHGFTMDERQSLRQLMDVYGMVDVFRVHHPTSTEYSWFSHLAQSRKKNKGWRIDYIFVQKELLAYVTETKILSDYFGSDHVPCYIDVKSSLI